MTWPHIRAGPLLPGLVVLLLLGLNAFGQGGDGVLTGVVRDSTGAIVPNAEVVITNTRNGVETRARTTDAGLYRSPYLPSGKYRINVSVDGFKTAIRDNLEVFLGQTVTADFVLEVGQMSEQVTVSAAPPFLETSTPEIEIRSTEKEIHTWPILIENGTRQIQSFIFSSLPGTSGDSFSGSINGGQGFSHEILIDGISLGWFNVSGGSSANFSPTLDAVSEFNLQTGSLSAQYGSTQTAVVNFGLKAGTNAYHGSLFWFNQNKKLNANTWENNRLGTPRSASVLNNFGATIGGPVIKNKTHFFFSYEGHREQDQRTNGTDSLPVAPFKNGDFSLLLDPAFTKDERSGTVVKQDALGRDVLFGQVYDPATSRQLGSGEWVRDPFPGNVIPADRISQVTRNVLKHDLPNPQLFQFKHNNPRVETFRPFLDIDNFSAKFDHVINPRHKLSGSLVLDDYYWLTFGSGAHNPGPIPGPAAAGDQTRHYPGWIVRLAEDWSLGSTRLNHFALGYNRLGIHNLSNSYLSGVDWVQELGLQGVGKNTFPEISFTGFNPTLVGGYARYGNGVIYDSPSGSTIVQDDFTWLRGRHSLRFGGEHRRYYQNPRSVINSGSYTFHNENTSQPGFTGSTGFAYASFLLGAVHDANLDIPLLTPGIRARSTALYFQDDWKLRARLALNLGLRWEIPTPPGEVRSRMSGLNPNQPDPGADGFPGAFEVLGNCSGCSGQNNFATTYYRQFAPRAGFAYQPRNKLVIRAGYGINFSPPILDGYDFPYFQGFDGSNPIEPPTGRFREDPSYQWDSPYPPFSKPLPNTDPSFLNGQGISWYLPEVQKLPYVQNWTLGLQFELPRNTKLEVNYIGNKGTRLNEPQYHYSLNQVQPRYLSLGGALLEDILDHPEIPKPYPSFEGSVSQALRPFPQYLDIGTHRTNNGYSTYHSLQATLNKHSSRGLSFIAAYTFSKSLATNDTAGPGEYSYTGQDIYNRKSDYSVTSFHVPHNLKITWILDLPFGPGARWCRSGKKSVVLGGWSLSAIQTYQSGNPLPILSLYYEYYALFNHSLRGDVLLPRSQQVFGSKPDNPDPENGTPYLNSAAFADVPKTSDSVPLHLGNAPRFLPNLRGFAHFGEDFSLIKRSALRFREGANFELRIDVVNILNRIGLSDPATDVSDPVSFGKVFGKSGIPRTIQLGARLNF